MCLLKWLAREKMRDDIKLCHWFPKFPFFYHYYQIWCKDCLKYENRMRLVGTPFVPPPPHHHHWHYFDITKLPYQKQYSRHVKKASESESFIDELISGFMMEFHHFLNEYDGILSFCQLAGIL